jgi:TRAP-type C4-dicarboxylate transport system permease small subunit
LRGVGIFAIILGVLFATCTTPVSSNVSIPVGTPETIIGVALMIAGVLAVIYSLRRNRSKGE